MKTEMYSSNSESRGFFPPLRCYNNNFFCRTTKIIVFVVTLLFVLTSASIYVTEFRKAIQAFFLKSDEQSQAFTLIWQEFQKGVHTARILCARNFCIITPQWSFCYHSECANCERIDSTLSSAGGAFRLDSNNCIGRIPLQIC